MYTHYAAANSGRPGSRGSGRLGQASGHPGLGLASGHPGLGQTSGHPGLGQSASRPGSGIRLGSEGPPVQHPPAHQQPIRRIPDPRTCLRNRRLAPRNYISPLLKCLIFSFNFLFWLFGMGVAGAGVWILVEKDKAIRDILDLFFDPSIMMCIAGLIVFTLGFLGCLGALRENICLLKAFHIMLTVILLLELVIGVLIFVFYFIPSARHELGFLGPEETLKQAIVRYRDDDDLRDMIDTIQQKFECCGVSNSEFGYRDWQDNMYFNCTESNPSVERCAVPHSCCIPTQDEMVNVMCGFDSTNKDRTQIMNKIYSQGCLKGFGSWLERNTIIVGAVCLSIVLPQILGICLSRSLIEQIQLQKAQWTYH